MEICRELEADLYKEHHEKLVRYLYNFLRSHSEAEELAQEAFLRLHKVQNPEKIISKKAFLYRIGHNLAMKNLRRRQIVKIETGVEDIEVESEEPSLDRQVGARQEYRILCQAMAELPPKCKQAFTLRMIHKKSFKEIAQELDISISTAEKHVLKGMRYCQNYMEKASRNNIFKL